MRRPDSVTRSVTWARKRSQDGHLRIVRDLSVPKLMTCAISATRGTCVRDNSRIAWKMSCGGCLVSPKTKEAHAFCGPSSWLPPKSPNLSRSVGQSTKSSSSFCSRSEFLLSTSNRVLTWSALGALQHRFWSWPKDDKATLHSSFSREQPKSVVKLRDRSRGLLTEIIPQGPRTSEGTQVPKSQLYPILVLADSSLGFKYQGKRYIT